MTDQERITALESRIATLEARLATLERNPPIRLVGPAIAAPAIAPFLPTPWDPWATYCSTKDLEQN